MKAKILLAGGGHGHVMVLHQLAKAPRADLQVTLLAKEQKQYYSGMASGFLEEIYQESEVYFDLKALCEKARVQYLQEPLSAIEPGKRQVHTSQGRVLAYDALSVNTGSLIDQTSLQIEPESAVSIKPLSQVRAIQQKILSLPEGAHLLVIGTGAAGVEIALAASRFIQNHARNIQVAMVGHGPALLAGFPESIVQSVQKELKKRRIACYQGESVQRIGAGQAVCASGKRLPTQLALLCSGSVPAFLPGPEFLTDAKGYLLGARTLQLIGHPNIFAAGDALTLQEEPDIPKAGVYAVRQAPFLWENILRYVQDRPLLCYRSRREYLSILSLGNRRAVFDYQGWYLKGSAAWRTKDRIDRRFMRNATARTVY